jgi:hypothetical protein
MLHMARDMVERMRLAGYVARIRVTINLYIILIEILTGKFHFGDLDSDKNITLKWPLK